MFPVSPPQNWDREEPPKSESGGGLPPLEPTGLGSIECLFYFFFFFFLSSSAARSWSTTSTSLSLRATAPSSSSCQALVGDRGSGRPRAERRGVAANGPKKKPIGSDMIRQFEVALVSQGCSFGGNVVPLGQCESLVDST